MSDRPKRVREPIQVYLTEAERAGLDRLARELGVSRAEVLRRGVAALQAHRARSFHSAFDPLVGAYENPDVPSDLAEHHDDYLGKDAAAGGAGRSRRRSS